MDFKQRKESFDPVSEYLKKGNCNMESLLGLRVHLQALNVAVDRGLERVAKNHWKIKRTAKIENEMNWLD